MDNEMKDLYVCSVCGYIYDPDKGIPDEGIEAGTDFKDLPASFKCPRCRKDKSAFRIMD